MIAISIVPKLGTIEIVVPKLGTTENKGGYSLSP